MRQAVGVAVALAAVVVWLRDVLARGPTSYDDAYMFLRYAGNLLAGNGLVWNVGAPPVFGATSLPHVLVVALLRAGLPWLADGSVLTVASLGAALAAVLVLLAAVRAGVRDPALRHNGGVVAGVLVGSLVMSDAYLFHAWTGMDTMLALLANAGLCWLVVRLARRPSLDRAGATSVVAYLSYLVRPDALATAALVPLLALVLLAQPGRRLRPALVFAVSFTLLVEIDMLIKRVWLGTALPLSAHAKLPFAYAGFAGEYSWNPFLFLRVFLASALPFVLVLLLFSRRRSVPVLAVWLAPVAIGFAGLFVFNQVMGHMGRLFFPGLAFVAMAAVGVLDGWLTEPREPAWIRGLVVRGCLAVLALVAGDAALHGVGAGYEQQARRVPLASLGGFAVAGPRLPDIDSWQAAQAMAELAAACPVGTRLAMSEHGLVGARAPSAVIIDVLGLHDPAFALRPFTTAELWRRDPDLIWMPHPDHTQMVRDILDSDELWARYEFYPEAFYFGVAIRKRGGYAPAVRRALEAQWALLYPGTPMAPHEARRASGDRLRP